MRVLTDISQLFSTPEEQQEIIRSIEDSLPSLTPFQRKQYEQTLQQLKDDKSANLQIVVIPATANMPEGIMDQSKLFKVPGPGEGHGMFAALCLQYPLSRGSIHIKSADPFEHPAIDPNFNAHPADAAVLAAGLRMLNKITDSKAMQGKLKKRVAPPPEIDLNDSKQGAEWARQIILSEYHPCGSVAMGDALDSRLRVEGVKGLRVIDGSVFPNHVSGNMVSSVYMVAEKGADLIKEDWQYAALSKKA